MRLYDIAFYSILFFLVGIFIASLKISLAIVIFSVFLISTVFLIYRLKWLALLSFVIFIGFFYCNLYNSLREQKINIPFGEKTTLSGIVIDYPSRGNTQKLTIKLQEPFYGKIIAIVRSHPSFDYGDLIKFEGAIKPPEPKNYADYLAKDGIFGTVIFPKTELLDGNQGSLLKSKLFKFKESIIENFQKTLTSEKAAFLSGITLGERAEFSKELKEKMNVSGTTHLVALSGQNITIIVIAVSSFLGYFMRRKMVLGLTLAIIIVFVLMTGAEASVVRAAIMGGIILLAKQIGRVHSMRNTIAVAALIMALHNPQFLRFDLGFQLSFLALIGIVYLSPAIRKFLKLKEGSGFLGWRENFLTTTSAQLAVMPLLLINFGNFSLFSLPANILILEVVPITMILGFLLGALGFIALPLAMILGWFVNLFLIYELGIIDVFSRISLPITGMEI
jgi:competence protein ComEC